VYIATGSSVPTIPSKSHDLADENKKVFDGMEMIRNNRIVIDVFKIKFVLFLYLLLSAS
jgi:hypothetical protein